MFAGNSQDFKEWEKGADLQQKSNNPKLECLKRCANILFESGKSLKDAEKCHEKCESSDYIPSSHSQKSILNNLSDKLTGI